MLDFLSTSITNQFNSLRGKIDNISPHQGTNVQENVSIKEIALVHSLTITDLDQNA
jgi:hypothetical protein